MLVNRGMGGGINAGQSFFLPLGDAGSGAVNTAPVSAFGDGTPTFTRAGATAWTRNSSGVWIGPIGANVARSYYSAAGVYLGYLAEAARTNHFLNSNAPVTQTSPSLGTGAYTLWMEGTGSVAVAQNTATITGAGTATAGTPVTFTVTVAGTVDYTVTGSPTIVQSEAGSFASSYIQTAGASVTRNTDVLTYASAGNFSDTAGTLYAEFASQANAGTGGLDVISTRAGGAGGVPMSINGSNQLDAFDGTANRTFAITFTMPFASTRKVAIAYGGTTINAANNGALGTAATFDGSFNSAANIGIGCRSTDGTNQLFGTIRNVRIWTRQLTDAQLQGLTS